MSQNSLSIPGVQEIYLLFQKFSRAQEENFKIPVFQELEFLGREGANEGSSKLGITALGQAGQVQCDNGPKNIPV